MDLFIMLKVLIEAMGFLGCFLKFNGVILLNSRGKISWTLPRRQQFPSSNWSHQNVRIFC